jgi:hypothetical protein
VYSLGDCWSCVFIDFLVDCYLQVKVSRDVQAIREFESSLLKGYQTYLKALLAALKPNNNKKAAADVGGNGGPKGSSSSSSKKEAIATARIAVRCMGQLAVARPGFNYFRDLLQALVPCMVHGDEEVASTACQAVQQLLQEDVQVSSTIPLARQGSQRSYGKESHVLKLFKDLVCGPSRDRLLISA